jgi:hypothetical protein
LDEDTAALPSLTTLTENNFGYFYISEQDVRDVLTNLNTSKASGPDEIHPRLLREAANIICNPIKTISTVLYAHNSFPNAFKLVNVSLIHTIDSKSEVTNCRPISLLSCLGTVMERCVFKHVYNYFQINNLFS